MSGGVLAAKKAHKTAPKKAAAPESLPWGLPAVAVAFAALAAYAPKLPFTTPYSPRFAALLLSAALLGFVALSRGRLDRRLALPAAASAAAVLLSAALSAQPGVLLTFGAEGGLMGAPSWLAMLAVFAAAASVPLGLRERDGAVLVFLWAAPVSLAGLLQVALGNGVSAGFGNGNYLGAALVLVLPIAFVSFRQACETAERAMWAAGGLLVAAMVSASGSAAAIVAAVVALFVLLALLPQASLGRVARFRRPLLASLGASIGLAALLAAGYLAGWLPGPVRLALQGPVFGRTALTRVEMWRMALAAWRDHPLLGVGPDGFQHASQTYLTAELVRLEAGPYEGFRALVRDPHSLPLAVLAMLGLAGAAMLAWLAVAWVSALRRRLAEDDGLAAWRAALAAGTAGFLACMTLMPWAVTFAALPALVAGLAVAPPPRRDGTPPSRGAGPYVLAAALGVAAVLLSASAIAGDAALIAGLRAGEPASALARFERAGRLQPTRPYLRYEALRSHGDLLLAGREPLEGFRSRVDAAPAEIAGDGGSMALLAQVALDHAQLSRRTDVAWERGVLERAATLAPQHPDVALERIHLDIVAGDLAAADAGLKSVQSSVRVRERWTLYAYQVARGRGEGPLADRLLARLEERWPHLSGLAEASGP